MSPARDQRRWAAVLANDPQADAEFVYAVKTTGVYCRPSCKSRTPLRANVLFFDDATDAEQAGFRACKRCAPHASPGRSRLADSVINACRRIEASDKPVPLAQLARQACMSPFHFHRLFKQSVGMTPRQYAMTHRDARARRALAQGQSVTEAMLDAGFEASSHFYASAGRNLGMTPAAFRAQGQGEVIRFALGETALGSVLVAGTARGICAIELGDDPTLLVQAFQDRFARAELVAGDAAFERHVAEVVGFVDSPDTGLDLPLDIQGSVFQRRVWQALQAVRCGETVSYAELAQRIGAPRSARAVAQACASNVLALAIPCHRVIRADGQSGGYRWGVGRKQRLLAHEAAASAGESTDEN